jgi:TIR domain
MSTTPIPLELFYSYADTDEPLLHELEKHLSLLKHRGLITTWHKRQIAAGSDWKEIVDCHLNTASVILLLISADFLASDYCYGIEMQQALQRHESGQARVVPVLLCPVDWQGAPFEKFKALPSNGKPITLWRNRDAAFADVVQGIRTALEEMQSWPVNVPSTPPSLTTQPSPKHSAVVITRFRALLSLAKFRGKGIHLRDVTLFGSRMDIDA